MKNLLITAACLLLITTAISGWSQLHDLLRTKEGLKSAADEAAASAGLCIDEQAFGEGYLRIDREEAEARAEEMLLLNLKEKGKAARWEVDFAEEGEIPSVTVTVYYKNLKAVSVYEYLPL